MDIYQALAAPFAPDVVSWRVGSTSEKDPDKPVGLALAYIDARDVMIRLDEVVGPENWQDRYEVHGGKTLCYLSVRESFFEARGGSTPEEVTLRRSSWVTKADGAGDSDVEAEKGALSDAFKRAAVKWGVGRYLYDIKSPWVDVEKRGKSFIIPESSRVKLRASLMASEPETRALHWAQQNAKAIKAVLSYPEAAKVLEDAGIKL